MLRAFEEDETKAAAPKSDDALGGETRASRSLLRYKTRVRDGNRCAPSGTVAGRTCLDSHG